MYPTGHPSLEPAAARVTDARRAAARGSPDDRVRRGALPADHRRRRDRPEPSGPAPARGDTAPPSSRRDQHLAGRRSRRDQRPRCDALAEEVGPGSSAARPRARPDGCPTGRMCGCIRSRFDRLELIDEDRQPLRRRRRQVPLDARRNCGSAWRAPRWRPIRQPGVGADCGASPATVAKAIDDASPAAARLRSGHRRLPAADRRRAEERVGRRPRRSPPPHRPADCGAAARDAAATRDDGRRRRAAPRVRARRDQRHGRRFGRQDPQGRGRRQRPDDFPRPGAGCSPSWRRTRRSEREQSRPLADGALREQVDRLLSGWKLDDPNPGRAMAQALQHLAHAVPMPDPSAADDGAPSDEADPLRVVQMSLEVGGFRPARRTRHRSRDRRRHVRSLCSSAVVAAARIGDSGGRCLRRQARPRPRTIATLVAREPLDLESPRRRCFRRCPSTATRCCSMRSQTSGNRDDAAQAARPARADGPRRRAAHRGQARRRTLVRAAEHAAAAGAAAARSAGVLGDAAGRSIPTPACATRRSVFS